LIRIKNALSWTAFSLFDRSADNPEKILFNGRTSEPLFFVPDQASFSGKAGQCGWPFPLSSLFRRIHGPGEA
jgi:hypothetical protein